MLHEKKGEFGKIDGKIIFVGFLWILQSAGRIFFAILGTPEGMGKFLDVPIPYVTSLILFIMFLSLGILGLITAFGLLTRRRWGFGSTIIVSIATIAFDLWEINHTILSCHRLHYTSNINSNLMF